MKILWIRDDYIGIRDQRKKLGGKTEPVCGGKHCTLSHCNQNYYISK